MKAQNHRAALPGEDLVTSGLLDLERGTLSDNALLVLIAAPRLSRLGFGIPNPALPASPEHLLFDQLNERLGPGAHSYYNSLLRRIVSFARALEREQSVPPSAQ